MAVGNSNPTISLYLDGEISFQLGRRGFAGTMPSLKVQMHDSSHAAILVIPGYHSSSNVFNLPLALQNGLFELVDIEPNAKISIPRNDQEPGELRVEAGARNKWFELKIDARDDFWMRLLVPGHKYEIRWCDAEDILWAYHENVQEDSQRLLVRRLPRPIKLNVFEDATAPPQFSVVLNSTSGTCHVDGEPRFGFKLQVTSQYVDLITVCLDKTPLKELHSLEEIAHVVDEEDEEVEWPYGIGCFEDENGFPSDDMFEEFKPGVSYERTFWLDKYNKDTSNGGELGVLDAGQTYQVKISQTLLKSFSKWRRGAKETLLAGEEKEKQDRWKGNSGQIVLDVSDPFTFDTT